MDKTAILRLRSPHSCILCDHDTLPASLPHHTVLQQLRDLWPLHWGNAAETLPVWKMSRLPESWSAILRLIHLNKSTKRFQTWHYTYREQGGCTWEEANTCTCFDKIFPSAVWLSTVKHQAVLRSATELHTEMFTGILKQNDGVVILFAVKWEIVNIQPAVKVWATLKCIQTLGQTQRCRAPLQCRALRLGGRLGPVTNK